MISRARARRLSWDSHRVTDEVAAVRREPHHTAESDAEITLRGDTS